MQNNNRKPHLLLRNQLFKTAKFDISRGNSNEENNASIEKSPEIYTLQKEKFRDYKEHLLKDRKDRMERRTLKLPSHIEYIKIYFFKDFDASLRTYFEKTYGLVPVFWEDLNQTVTLAIDNTTKFDHFLAELDAFINSGKDISPQGKSYAILITISSFEFLSSEKISTSSKSGTIIIQLVDGLRIINRFEKIQKSLQVYLTKKNYDWQFLYNDIIEIKNVNKKDYQAIVDNFDIIEATTSFKLYKRHPGTYGERVVSQYTLNIDETAPLIGVIDTGVNPTDLLKNIIVDYGLDLTDIEDPKTFFDDTGHGTAVAGLVAYGKQPYTKTTELTNQARIVPIKVMNNSEDNFSISALIEAIRIAHKKGVQIFSLSINTINIKRYNENISYYAYLLDKIAYELNILIFISSGNIDREFVENYIENESFKYPKHFFNPNHEDHILECYDCSETNICPPADSMNNITVGAIAENFEEGLCDVSLDKSLPAYYTKKWHLSPNFPVNGSKRVKKSQYNSKIFKPDILAPGGDMLSVSSAMKVMTNDTTKPYTCNAGSSLATPLMANLAARILKLYPSLSPQSIKALIINSTKRVRLEGLTPFENLILEIKKRHSKELINKTFNELEELNKEEKRKLSSVFSLKKLEQTLTGHGVPDDNIALESNNKRVTMVVEETVKTGNYHGFYINLPKYVKNLASNSNKGIFDLSLTLAYNFKPIYGNSLAYNPLHISFNVLKDIGKDIQKAIDLISDRSNGHEEAFFRNNLTWSDDFYPLNSKPFSNCQRIKRRISSNDLLKLIDNFIIVVRCNIKDKVVESEELKKLKKTKHNFSIVITIEEISDDPKITGNLYDEILNENTAEPIIDIDTELELTL